MYSPTDKEHSQACDRVGDKRSEILGGAVVILSFFALAFVIWFKS